MKKRLAVLGATGSIGKSSLDVILKHKETFEIVLLSAHSSHKELEQLKNEWPSAVCVLSGKEGGKKNLLEAIGNVQPDITINGISGSAGLEPSLAAIKAGSNLALANKETVVMAGELVFRSAKAKNVKIIPVDSEHSAIFHLLQRENLNHRVTQSRNFEGNAQVQDQIKKKSEELKSDVVSEIILTASGGPFRKLSLKEMESVTAKDALAHPIWNMGPKITIDSASMANKGLEIIEACSFFNMPPEKIKVVIHPQSIVHSMIRLCNGVFHAQLSKPDMRHLIADALFWPDTAPLNLDVLSFDSLTLEFEKCDMEKFPMVKLAYEAAKHGGLYPCAYNAANEIAAAAFLENRISFTDIPKIIENVMQADWSKDNADLETILQADASARLKVKSFIN